MKKTYQVLSPDSFPIMVEGNITFTSQKKAKEALKQFINNYKHQGYYSQLCYNGYKREISINHIADYCEIITI